MSRESDRSMIPEKLRNAFVYYLRGGNGRVSALQALAKARASVAKGETRDPSSIPQGWNPESDGARYVDNLAAAGLRFIGWADTLLLWSHHRGWYFDVDSEGVYRGAVLQLPARDGRPMYLAAYADPDNDGAFIVDTTSLTSGERGGADDTGDIARAADEFARVSAEKEREYHDAWRAGQRYADLVTEARDATRDSINLASDTRATMREARARVLTVPFTAITNSDRRSLAIICAEGLCSASKTICVMPSRSRISTRRGRSTRRSMSSFGSRCWSPSTRFVSTASR